MVYVKIISNHLKLAPDLVVNLSHNIYVCIKWSNLILHLEFEVIWKFSSVISLLICLQLNLNWCCTKSRPFIFMQEHIFEIGWQSGQLYTNTQHKIKATQ